MTNNTEKQDIPEKCTYCGYYGEHSNKCKYRIIPIPYEHISQNKKEIGCKANKYRIGAGCFFPNCDCIFPGTTHPKKEETQGELWTEVIAIVESNSWDQLCDIFTIQRKQ